MSTPLQETDTKPITKFQPCKQIGNISMEIAMTFYRKNLIFFYNKTDLTHLSQPIVKYKIWLVGKDLSLVFYLIQ